MTKNARSAVHGERFLEQWNPDRPDWSPAGAESGESEEAVEDLAAALVDCKHVADQEMDAMAVGDQQ